GWVWGGGGVQYGPWRGKAAVVAGCVWNPPLVGTRDLAPEVLLGARGQQRDGASAEAASGHPRAADSVDLERRVDQEVELGAAHLVIVPQAAVRFGHQPAHLPQVAMRAGLHKLVYSPILRNYVPGARRRGIGRVAQARDTQFLCSRGALSHPVRISRAGERVLNHRVYSHECGLARQGYEAV